MEIHQPTAATRPREADLALQAAIDSHQAKAFPCDPLGKCWRCGTPMRPLGRDARAAAICGCAIWLRHPNGHWEPSRRQIQKRVLRAQARQRRVLVGHEERT